METWSNPLFYLVFSGQIALISWYFPSRLLSRMKRLIDAYPPAEYPRLYPRSEYDYVAAQVRFQLITRAILVLGVVILLAVMFVVDHATFADDGYISEAWPAFYGMIQMIPFILVELSGHSQLKLMRQARTSTRRTAQLSPRRLFDFISPALVALAVLVYLGTIGIDVALNGFDMDLGQDSTQRPLWLTVSIGVMVAFAAMALYGRKSNPHQSHDDWVRQIRVVLRSTVYGCMTVSVFMLIQAIDQVYDMDFLDAILLSLFMQAVVTLSIGYVLNGLRLEDIDFEVYRDDAAAST